MMRRRSRVEFVETEFEVASKQFERLIMPNVKLKRLATGFDWTEGPVWFGDRNCLLFSDIPNDKIYRWSEVEGLSVFRSPSNFANGNTRDRQGRLITCEHGERRVTRTEYDGSVTVLADRYLGKRLNSPNDVVVTADNCVWFSDPIYGIASNHEGFKSKQEIGCNVYRHDPATKRLDLVIDKLDNPNGLAFSPDESWLYVSDTGRRHAKGGDRAIFSFRTGNTDFPIDGNAFFRVDCGASDGFRVDTKGNIWTSAGDGVHCVDESGQFLGKLFVPEVVSNVCFGGRAKNRLFITACTSLYSIVLDAQGSQHP